MLNRALNSSRKIQSSRVSSLARSSVLPGHKALNEDPSPGERKRDPIAGFMASWYLWRTIKTCLKCYWLYEKNKIMLFMECRVHFFFIYSYVVKEWHFISPARLGVDIDYIRKPGTWLVAYVVNSHSIRSLVLEAPLPMKA